MTTTTTTTSTTTTTTTTTITTSTTITTTVTPTSGKFHFLIMNLLAFPIYLFNHIKINFHFLIKLRNKN
jgi:hypothetical protein